MTDQERLDKLREAGRIINEVGLDFRREASRFSEEQNPESERSSGCARELIQARFNIAGVEDTLLKRLGIREDRVWWKN